MTQPPGRLLIRFPEIGLNGGSGVEASVEPPYICEINASGKGNCCRYSCSGMNVFYAEKSYGVKSRSDVGG